MRVAVLPFLFSVLLPGAGLHAQVLRDPTVAPVGVRGVEPTTVADVGGAATAAMAVIRRDGKPHLVVGTRLVAQGQLVGQARIERISETELWLREGAVLRKLPMFSGVQRSPAASPSAPCAGAKPGRANAAETTEPPSVAPFSITCDPAKP
ncbi:hypothetical protein [Rhodoferax sp.]|uniref:hypothetical protein n=1 Tax=Rhodoferax sp. TaxID=50421 RepID=UPI00274A078A|nr:hypothetical protein [Rhodoferax sp.]